LSTQTLDLSKLSDWMKKNVCDFSGPLSAEKFAGGQSNPTFKLSAGDRKFVLRRKPPGQLLASAHAVDREFRVIAALQDTDVPVPGAVALCKEDEIIGSMFYLMEYLEGRVFWDPVLPELTNDERSAVYDDMNRVLAAMHSINVADVAWAIMDDRAITLSVKWVVGLSNTGRQKPKPYPRWKNSWPGCQKICLPKMTV